MDLVKALKVLDQPQHGPLTAVENEYDNAIDIMKAIYPKTGNARILGITAGPWCW